MKVIGYIFIVALGCGVIAFSVVNVISIVKTLKNRKKNKVDTK